MMLQYQPQADPRNTFVYGNARFTYIQDRLLRMEWAADGAFIDLASLTVVNRQTSSRSVQTYSGDRRITLNCRGLEVKYHNDGKPFSQRNLEINFSFENRLTGKRESVRWHPGKINRGNLAGTCRALDEYDGDTHRPLGKKSSGKLNEKLKLDPGLLSLDGWALVDDSRTVLRSGPRSWFEERSAAHKQDWYFLAYGHDYHQALKESAGVFGAQPLPPRYALGYWWSRYWAYTDQDLLELVGSFEEMGFPLDVLVVDMDWHLGGWTGYTWNHDYFPDPQGFLKRIKARGLRVSLNLHPADGVGSHEEMYPEIARALGVATGNNSPKKPRIPFDCTDPQFMRAYFRYLHHPKEKEGVDFWWIDWQQGTESTVQGLDPLPWLNIQHWEDAEHRKRSQRPLILSRYGGLGSGRYPVGFSGDSLSTWKSLAFQPFFTATAANVLFGYWSHDIGGHMPGVIDPELYTRWIQFGVYSPVVRTHITKNAEAERRFWSYPDPFCTAMKDALKLRYQRVPYIYTENRKGLENGISLCRPLYYSWPGEPEAYQSPGQYLFGSQMLLAPVTRPLDPKLDLAQIPVWLPSGDWIDTAVDQKLQGGQRVNRSYALAEIPAFVRPGTVIPGQFEISRLNDKSYKNLLVEIWPGSEGAYLLYEDDGISQGYLHDQEAWFVISYGESKTALTVEIRRAGGAYPQLLGRKSLMIRLYATPPPAGVYSGRNALPWSYQSPKQGWTYEGQRGALTVRLTSCDLDKGVKIRVQRNTKLPKQIYGLHGLFQRLELIRSYSTRCSTFTPLHPDESLPVRLAQTGFRIARNPERFDEELQSLKTGLTKMTRILSAMETEARNSAHLWFSVQPLIKARAIWDHTRKAFSETIADL